MRAARAGETCAEERIRLLSFYAFLLVCTSSGLWLNSLQAVYWSDTPSCAGKGNAEMLGVSDSLFPSIR